jgi:hypothetical protein
MLNDGEQSNEQLSIAAYTRLARLWCSRSSTSDAVHSWGSIIMRLNKAVVALHFRCA